MTRFEGAQPDVTDRHEAGWRRAMERRIRRIVEMPFRREPRFVIVGAGRSGTGFIANVLSSVGIRCGHEEWWAPYDRKRGFLVGDASWCATFELDRYRGRIFHQMRDPLRMVRSVAAHEVGGASPDNPWFQYRRRYVHMIGDPLEDAVVVVDKWTARAEEIAEWTWRVEDVDAPLIVEIGRRLGYSVDVRQAERAILAAPRNQKADRMRSLLDIGWSDLPEIPATERLMELAKRYRYDVRDA